jgi:hypothetical protein
MAGTRATAVTEGIIAGLIGHLGLAAVVALADLSAGRSLLFTPSLLGSVLFGGAVDACRVAIGPTPVLAYFAVHLPVMLAFGVLASFLVRESERHPTLWFLALLTFITVGWHLAGAVVLMLGPVTGCLSLGWIFAASGVAAAAMATYLVARHRALRRSLADDRYA